MWHSATSRQALLELIETQELRKRRAQTDAWNELLSLGWTRLTDRQGVAQLVEARRPDVERLLDRCWPNWRDVADRLRTGHLPPTEAGLRALLAAQRSSKLPVLPTRLNRRTATAAVAPHSKAGLHAAERALLAAVELTSDGLVRLRGCQGLALRRDGKIHDAYSLEHLLGEVVLSERAFRDGTRIVGKPRAMLLIENAGSFVDLAPAPGWLLVHVPGWNIDAARKIFSAFSQVPVVHFGDLDPRGAAIFRLLQSIRPSLRWAIPDFFHEYIADWSLPAAWPDIAELTWAPPLVQQLAAEGRWLEQEAFVLDSRLWPAIEMLAFETQHAPDSVPTPDYAGGPAWGETTTTAASE